jgi:hypothetical protein
MKNQATPVISAVHRVACLTVLTVALLGLFAFTGPAPAGAEPVSYYGGNVIEKPHVYLTFWGSNWSQRPGARAEVESMFSNLSGSGWQNILSQYYDQGPEGTISNQVTVSSWNDQSIAAPGEVTEKHLENEIEYALTQRSWPGAGINNFYFVIPAPGSTFNPNGFFQPNGEVLGYSCGGHRYSSALGAPYGWTGWQEGKNVGINCQARGGEAELTYGQAISAVASHEFAEAASDPEGERSGHRTGWMAPQSGAEIADQCNSSPVGHLSGGATVVGLWSNRAGKCMLSEAAPTPIVNTGEATNVTWNQATLRGTVKANGPSTSYYFQYGTTTAYGEATGAAGAGTGWNQVPVSANTGFLKSNTTYHYRIVATNSAGTTYGADRTFTTSSSVGVFFPDAAESNSTTRWGWSSTSGWQQEFLYGHAVAAGTHPTTLVVNGTPNVFFVDAANNNTITDWTWTAGAGWQQTFFYGHTVAKGTSPSAIMLNGRPFVFFVDATNNNSLSYWSLDPSAGWQQTFLYGHPAAAGTSPSAINSNEMGEVFFVDATNNNTITNWRGNLSTSWQQTFLYGHTVAAGSSPSAIFSGGNPGVFFSDATNNNSISFWISLPGQGWQQGFFYGHPVAKGTSPSVIEFENSSHIIFSDATNNNSITEWTWNGSEGWHQTFLYGHAVAAGTSPVPVVSNNSYPNGNLSIFFVDAPNNNSITRWRWNSTNGWQQEFLYGHAVSAGSGPGAL